MSAPSAMALDLANLIYASSSESAIFAVGAMPGSNPQRLLMNQSAVRWITTDVGAMYWIAGDKIMRAHKDGSGVLTYASGQTNPVRIIVDDANVYWINHAAKSNGGGVFKMPK